MFFNTNWCWKYKGLWKVSLASWIYHLEKVENHWLKGKGALASLGCFKFWRTLQTLPTWQSSWFIMVPCSKTKVHKEDKECFPSVNNHIYWASYNKNILRYKNWGYKSIHFNYLFSLEFNSLPSHLPSNGLIILKVAVC